MRNKTLPTPVLVARDPGKSLPRLHRPALRQSGLMRIKDFETLIFLDTDAIKP